MENLSLYGLNESTISLGDPMDSSSHHHHPADLDRDSSSLSPSNSKSSKRWSNMSAESSLHQAKRTLLQWRTCVLLLWLITSVIVSTATFFYLSHLEQEEFEGTFQQSATWMKQTAEQKATAIMAAWETERDDITAFTQSTRVQWPYVLIPYWEKRASHFRQATFTTQVTLAPLVEGSDVDMWERFATYIGQSWIQEGQVEGQDEEIATADEEITAAMKPIPSNIFPLLAQDINETVRVQGQGRPQAPFWQTSPPPVTSDQISVINFDVLSDNTTWSLYSSLMAQLQLQERKGQQQYSSPVMSDLSSDLYYYYSKQNSDSAREIASNSLLMEPIYDSFNKTARQVTGLLIGLLDWTDLIRTEIMPSNSIRGMVCVLENTCGSSATYQTTNAELKSEDQNDGKSTSTAILVGAGDHHHSQYHSMGITALFGHHQQQQEMSNTACHYSLHFYPSPSMENDIKSNRPKYVTLLIATVLTAFGVVFIMYVYLMQQRHNKVHAVATKASSVIASLFPSMVRDRIMEDVLQQERPPQKTNKASKKSKTEKIETTAELAKKSLLGENSTSPDESSRSHDNISNSKNTSFLETTANAMGKSTTAKGSNVYKTKPIADLFPEATVLFADIVGFTAWSSTREPCQVFDLLETIYHCFDELAKKRHVFKVETVGDCYVAVTGLPAARKDHAILACKFAKDCLRSMDIVTKKLEVALGPDTSDLSMRFGLHSGPVTAGVLRGERSRFQLFGDTVNTAARMESNGKPGRIHISQETANYLVAGDKADWFIHRDDKIVAKGKGLLQTYWLDPMAMEVSSTKKGKKGALDFDLVNSENDNTAEASHPTLRAAMEIEKNNHRNDDPTNGLLSEREQRLIDWTVQQLLRLLEKIVAKRAQSGQHGPVGIIPEAKASQEEIVVFNEVKEIIALPDPETESSGKRETIDPSTVELHPDVTWQLFDYVTSISTLYRNNPFHNFEHATHVTLSVTKMLSRIVAPGPNNNQDEIQGETGTTTETPSAATDNGYGIATDPLTQFAVVFSALIHDVDHLGVTNAQLVKENSHLARVYKNQSVAEQNSVNIAWDMLMDPAFSELRSCIYSSENEFVRFRQLVVNAVMATDIVDKDLKALRNARWETAFRQKNDEKVSKEDIDRKATIVIEHLMQASDVSHTMQHWHVYRKWNAKLYRELYCAYLKGRMETDPTEFWYKGELGFFDFYIIPLAKKLRDCGVFGVSCDEYLSYALQNKAEWEKNGMDVVNELRESVRDLDEQYAKEENSTED